MRTPGETNGPEEHVSALRAGGHEIRDTRDTDAPRPTAADETITAFAEHNGVAILSTDITGFGARDASIPILVAPRDVSDSEVGIAVFQVEMLAFDPAETEPIRHSELC